MKKYVLLASLVTLGGLNAAPYDSSSTPASSQYPSQSTYYNSTNPSPPSNSSTYYNSSNPNSASNSNTYYNGSNSNSMNRSNGTMYNNPSSTMDPTDYPKNPSNYPNNPTTNPTDPSNYQNPVNNPPSPTSKMNAYGYNSSYVASSTPDTQTSRNIDSAQKGTTDWFATNDDNKIGYQIRQELNTILGFNNFPDVSIYVDHGDVKITGKVPNQDTKSKITSAVRSIKGVKSINNRLEVTSTKK